LRLKKGVTDIRRYEGHEADPKKKCHSHKKKRV